MPSLDIRKSHQPFITFREVLQDMLMEADCFPSKASCQYYKAKRFYHGTNGFEYADGTIPLISNDVLDQLYPLFTSKSTELIKFCAYIQAYNNKLENIMYKY